MNLKGLDTASAEFREGLGSDGQTGTKVNGLNTGDGVGIEEDIPRHFSNSGLLIGSLAQDTDNVLFVPQDDLPHSGREFTPPHTFADFALLGRIQGQPSLKTVKIRDSNQDPRTHLSHEMGIHHEVISGKTAVDGLFKCFVRGHSWPKL